LAGVIARQAQGGQRRSAPLPTLRSLRISWRVAVHGLQLAMGEGEGRRHIHLAGEGLFDRLVGGGMKARQER
jgi:hypothetical protein